MTTNSKQTEVRYIAAEQMIEVENQVEIPVMDEVILLGDLKVPAGATGIVLFVHGSGSSRFSPRNHYVAEILNRAGLATLLFDLLTPAEEAVAAKTTHLRFDIELLSKRLVAVTEWIITNPLTHHLKVGYFGASTGAAAALLAAARWPEEVKAVVSRGGRPDLAGWALLQVKAPTLLIVGGNDSAVLDLNRGALANLQVEKKLQIVPEATHLFEEPGALERVAELTQSWFKHYL
jgi:dienelactone hydrolase